MFFILGRNPTLSFAELLAVLNKFSPSYQIEILSKEVVVVLAETQVDTANLMGTLGGTVKIGEVVTSVSWDQSETEFEQALSATNLTSNFFLKSSGKIRFGISIYDGGGDAALFKQLTSEQKNWHIKIKENLKNAGISSGFTGIKERMLSSATVAKEQMIRKGAEIVFIVAKDALYIGVTRQVQAFEEFAFRDIARPGKDKRSGIMPPKLARMMINLAGMAGSGVLLDPFCGSATVVLEAMALGLRHIIASDTSDTAISDTQKNIRWLSARYNNKLADASEVKVIKGDVKNLASFIKPQSIDAIVTEPYLGPPLFAGMKASAVERISHELAALYVSAFAQFARVLKKSGKVVIIFPVFPIAGKLQFIDIIGEISKMGFAQKDLIPVESTANPYIALTSRKTILFGGDYKFLQREILKFEFI